MRFGASIAPSRTGVKKIGGIHYFARKTLSLLAVLNNGVNTPQIPRPWNGRLLLPGREVRRSGELSLRFEAGDSLAQSRKGAFQRL